MTKAMSTKLVERLSGMVQKKTGAIFYGAIGVDFGLNDLRMVQFRKNADAIEIHASCHFVIAEEERNSSKLLCALIKRALKENNFVGREVVTCIQPANVKIFMLSFMRQPEKNDEELIVERVAERIDGSIENYVIDFMMVRPKASDAQERSVLVAIADHEEVVSYLEHLRKIGLKVSLLEIEPTAVRHLLSAKYGAEHDANLMSISMGHSQTYITVLSGRRLIYARDIDFGEQQLINMLCKELDIDEHEARTILERSNNKVDENNQNEEVTTAFYSVLKPLFMELAEDINRALIYTASETRGLPVKHVYLTNRIATWHGIENFISTLIEVPVSVLTPFDGFINAEKFNAGSGPRGAVVTGMALHGLTKDLSKSG